MARQARPDIAAGASVANASFPKPTVLDARAAKKLATHAKEHAITLTVLSFPDESLRRVWITDSAFDTSGQQKCQHGLLIGYSDPSLAAGKMTTFGLVSWKSRKL